MSPTLSVAATLPGIIKRQSESRNQRAIAPVDNVHVELCKLIARTPDIEVAAVAEPEAAESVDTVVPT